MTIIYNLLNYTQAQAKIVIKYNLIINIHYFGYIL